MLTKYPALFIKERKNQISVFFIDLNYLATWGSNYDEAYDMAIDCLASYIYDERLDGNDIPLPSNLDHIDIAKAKKDLDINNIDDKDISIQLVAVDIDKYIEEHFTKSIKKTLTIPIYLDKLAKKNNINFSKLLKEALIEKLIKNKTK